jgi:CBS-domain-containing membrane protein
MKHRKIRAVMTADVVTVRLETPFKEIAILLHQRDVSAVPVVDAERHVLGIVSQADLLPKQGAQEPPAAQSPLAFLERYWDRGRADATTAEELMTTPVYAIGPDATVVEAARVLDRRCIKRLPVVDDAGVLVGIVGRADLLSVFLRSDKDIRDEVVRDVFERNLGIAVTPATVTVSVDEGVVTLRGELERKSTIPIAETLTRQVDGVVDVRAGLTFVHDDTHLRIPDAMAVDITHEPWLNH